MHLTDHIHQFRRRSVFEEITPGARFESALDLNITLKGREHDNSGFAELRPDRAHRVNAAQIRKPQIHQRNVRPVLAILLNAFSASGRL